MNYSGQIQLSVVVARAIRIGASTALAAIVVASCSAISRSQSFAQPAANSERRVEEISIRMRDGRELSAVVSSPAAPGQYPVIVSVHGGMGDRPIEVMRDAAAPDSDSPTVQMFNQQDWVILAPDFRKAWFGAEETDIVDAISFASQLPDVDPEKVAVFGGSNGGRLSLRASIIAPQSMGCVVAGSPFLTNPVVFFEGELSQAPWSTASDRAQSWMSTARDRLRPLVSRAAGKTSSAYEAFLTDHSVEENAARIEARVLLLTSRADEQVPHDFVQGLIDRLHAAGNPAEVLTLEHSLHGFYWGREGEFGARVGRGEKTPAQLEEEARTRQKVLSFLNECFEG